MIKIFSIFEKRINGVIFSLLSNGVILLLLGILIIWTDFMLRLVIGLIVFVIAYGFFYSAYKLWLLKKELEKHILNR